MPALRLVPLSTFRSMSLLVVACSVLSGCAGNDGPEIATVSGTILADGKPLDGASITFVPKDGRPSVATSDAEGHYKLSYTNDKQGAVVGPHTVRVTTARDASGGEGDQPLVPARKELLPAHYNTNSDLTAEVKSGDNIINFELQTKAP